MRIPLRGRVPTELTSSRTGTSCPYSPMFRCERGDATLTASSGVLGEQTRWICPDSGQGWVHSPPHQLLNQPAINKRGSGLLEKLPTCFFSIFGACLLSLSLLHKGSPGDESWTGWLQGSNPKRTAFFGLGCGETFQGVGHL